MRVFERIGTWLWTFGKGVQPDAPVISNDELVTAYEWVLAPLRFEVDPSTLPPQITSIVPEHVAATLRKLGAR